MKQTIGIGIFCFAIAACNTNKNIAQTTSMQSHDILIANINSSKSDTDVMIPHIKTLQQQNDFVIAFGTLNYAWARRGTYYVLAVHNKIWKMYRYESKLPSSAEDKAAEMTPLDVSAEASEKIKQQYALSELWKTEGDNGENFCTGKKDCNINDAETWTMSVTTPQNIHTTTYYAPEFFEECCPGNKYRKQFVNIAKEMMKLIPDKASLQEK